MNLVKLGSRYINLDCVYQISFNDKQVAKNPEADLEATLDVNFPVSVYPDGSEDSTGPLEAAGMRVFGKEAEALRHYLDREGVDVEKYYREDLEDEQERVEYSAWVKRVEVFATERGSGIEEASNYRLWLANRHGEAANPEPTEESYAEFREGPVSIPF